MVNLSLNSIPSQFMKVTIESKISHKTMTWLPRLRSIEMHCAKVIVRFLFVIVKINYLLWIELVTE
jgi:hypothetical protein